MILLDAALFLITFILALPLYALPASLSLKRGRRPGLKPLTLNMVADQLQDTGLEGVELAEAARSLVAKRMVYCRRNSFDLYSKAFERGYGYCQQHAYALADLLNKLGFEAKVVHAFRNRFPDGQTGGHAWVQVSLEGQWQHLDTLFYDQETGAITFKPKTKVRHYSPAFRILAGWGSSAINAHYYYFKGRDFQ
jgi:hypothetical protein